MLRRSSLPWLLVFAIGSLASREGAATALSFSAIQTAVNACSANGCTIQLDCGLGSDSSAASAGLARVSIGARHNIRIQGCGMDASTLEWHASLSNGSNWFIEMFDVNPGAGSAGSITFADMTLNLDVTCGNGSQDCGSVPAVVAVTGNVTDVKFERMHIKSTLKGTNTGGGSGSDNFPAGVKVTGNGGTPSVMPEGIYVFSSKFETSGTGAYLAECDDCWVEGSYFEDAPVTSPSSKRALALVWKSVGEGVRVMNNTFDMHPNNPTGLTYGLLLWNDVRGGAGHILAGEGAQVIGNTFEDIPSSVNSRAVVLYGYNDAVISGNRFRCDPSATPCATWGIETEGGCNGPCNRRNILANNVFDQFVDNGTNCPIFFKTPNGPDMTGSSQNLVIGNMFVVPTAGSNGVCGPNEGSNTITGNQVVPTP
jgi:hypothetical protein